MMTDPGGPIARDIITDLTETGRSLKGADVSERDGQDLRGVDSLAARLRMIQADLGHESAEIRRGHLCDEIERALASVLPDERASFLRSLSDHFPSWDAALTVSHEREAAGLGQAAVSESELRDPAFLVERLEDIADALTPEQRSAVAARLEAVGLSSGGSFSDGHWPQEPRKKLDAALRATGSDSIDAARLLELSAMLIDLVVRLDQIAWSTWKAMAPRSEFKRKGTTQETMRRFISGDQDVARGQVAEELERLRSLAGALISTIGKVGFISYRQVAKLAPGEIEVLAKPEKKALESLEVACWRKYRQLAGNLDQALVEAEVLGSMSDTVEALIRGLSR
ncbi:MAG: hypothetical protein KF902_05080 [Phycisphaeraceae bacterium]|nr:hypothetical protein [Phycisphaeraceae bacterium]MCW5768025.1 hypothetical protein [Phycisphaeraceae bacterium]